MKAVVLEEIGKISMREIEIKEELSPNDVRIEPKCVGICGSDVHYYKYGKIGDFIVNEPMVLGHEASGVVTEVGENIKHLKVGDRVCMEPGIPNFQSSETMNGMYNLDPEVKFWATPPIHGCLRDYFIHPGILTFKLPDNVSFEEGAAVEPVAIGMYSAKKAQIEPGDIALVMGAGTIGIVTAISALSSGCSKVIITDIKDDKLDIVRKNYPSITCVNAAKENLQEIIDNNTTNGVDIFFEATGARNILATFTSMVKPGGKAVLIGMPIEPVKLDVVGCQAKEITLFTIFRYVNMFERSLRLISSGTLNVKPLITHNYSYDDAIEAFEFAATEPGNAIKIMLHK